MSRNPHEPTPVLRQSVSALAASGLPQFDIARIVGCSEKTLRLHYRDELDEGMEDANAAVVDFLMHAIDEGKVVAMIFFEKCKGGQRDNDRPKNIPASPRPGGRLPCNGVGICTLRHTEFYVPGEEYWPPIC